MVKNRIATTAALVTFALAPLGGVVVALAAPAHADATATADGTAMTATASQAVGTARGISDELETSTRGSDISSVPAPGSSATAQHVTFPLTPASPHTGQGKKGSNEPR